jgi:hypothetical protein
MSRTGLLIVVLASCSSDTSISGPDAGSTQAALVARGKYLVDITGCSDCHTPWMVTPGGPAALGGRLPDETRAFAGHPADQAMGPLPTVSAPGKWTVNVRAPDYTAWAGSFGIAYTANLTPDPATGWLEGWTDADFIKVIRTGKAHDGTRDVVGTMMRVCLRMAKATDDDLKAVFAYLRSLAPVPNDVPAYDPPDAGH